jgi:hypothetical protein
MNPNRRPKSNRRVVRAGVAATLVVAGAGLATTNSASAASSSIKVTSAADAGPGTLRDALARAQRDPGIAQIVISDEVGTISPITALTFVGGQALSIKGGGVVVDGSSLPAGDLLTLGAPSLEIRDLGISNSPEDGLVVLGASEVDLGGITATANAAQGVLVDDLGADHGIEVDVRQSLFDDNGVGVCDTDGMRVNEQGPGSIVARFVAVTATNNDHDGIELDERGDGDAIATMRNSTFADNGYNDCTEPEVDLEDGFDVDEIGPGNLVVDIANSSFTGNAEEGLDLDEGDDEIDFGDGTLDGPGDLIVTLRNVDASDNGAGAEEDNIDIDEVGDGDYTVDMRNVTSNGGFNDNYDGSEEGQGNLYVTLTNSSFSASIDGRGVDLGESGPGSHTVVFGNVAVDGNDSDGFRGEEEDAGDMAIEARNGSFVGNGGDSFDLSKEEAPEGTLTLRNTAYDNTNLDNVILIGG